MADAAALLAAAPGRSQPERGGEGVVTHHPDGGEKDREGDRSVMAGAADQVLVHRIAGEDFPF